MGLVDQMALGLQGPGQTVYTHTDPAYANERLTVLITTTKCDDKGTITHEGHHTLYPALKGVPG